MKKLSQCITVVTYILLGGCETAPPPASALQQHEWTLEADFETKTPQVLTRGETRASVIEKLGPPKRKEHLKSDREVEILSYERTVVGPYVQRFWKTVQGNVSVRKPQMFIDRIAVYLRKGEIEAIVVERRLEADAMSRSHME